MIANILTNAGRSGEKSVSWVFTIQDTMRSLTGLPFLGFPVPPVFSEMILREMLWFQSISLISEELGGC